MKKSVWFVLALSTLVSATAFADDFKATCTASAKDVEEIGLFGENATSVKVRVSGESISVDVPEYGTMTGKFERVAKNGSDMYSSTDLLDVADQTDIANIFVSKTLARTGNGPITFSVRQLGDSEGSWWINATYFCRSN